MDIRSSGAARKNEVAADIGARTPRRGFDNMKALLILTALLEAATGLCLLAMPALLDWVLLGGRFEAAASVIVARIAGGALLALGIACWFASSDVQNRAAYGVVAAMLVYNVTVAALLVYADV